MRGLEVQPRLFVHVHFVCWSGFVWTKVYLVASWSPDVNHCTSGKEAFEKSVPICVPVGEAIRSRPQQLELFVQERSQYLALEVLYRLACCI